MEQSILQGHENDQFADSGKMPLIIKCNTIMSKKEYAMRLEEFKAMANQPVMLLPYDCEIVTAARKCGKWKAYKPDNPVFRREDGSPMCVMCSECGFMVSAGRPYEYWNYCPKCGAYMKEVET